MGRARGGECKRRGELVVDLMREVKAGWGEVSGDGGYVEGASGWGHVKEGLMREMEGGGEVRVSVV